MVKIGLIGGGFIADRYMQALSEISNQEVEVVFSIDEESAVEFANKWDIKEWTIKMDDVVERDLDLVIVALPNYVHKQAVLLVAEAGKNIVCTKPLALNSNDAAEMLGAVKKAGILHGYAENHVFIPINMKIKEMIDSNGIGEVSKINIKIMHSGPHSGWFRDPKLTGGGALVDLGCHAIEDIRYFFGKDQKLEEVLAWGSKIGSEKNKEDENIEDNSVLIMKFSNEKIGIVEVSWTVKGGLDIRNEIYGSEGVIFADITKSSGIKAYSSKGGFGYIVEKAELETGWTYPVLSEKEESIKFGYKNQIKHFIECIAENKMPRENFEDGYIVNKIIDAAYKSMRTKKWEKI